MYITNLAKQMNPGNDVPNGCPNQCFRKRPNFSVIVTNRKRHE